MTSEEKRKGIVAKAFVKNDEGKYVPSKDGKPVPISDKAARAKAIEDAVEAKKAKEAPKGSVAEKKAQATAPGVVKPSKPARPTSIPRSLSRPRVDDTDTTTEESIEEYVDGKVSEELDEAVKPKKKEKVDDGLMSVSDVARALGVDPKRARARLRAAGKAASEGRWARIAKDSPEYAAIALIVNPPAEVSVESDDESEGDDE